MTTDNILTTSEDGLRMSAILDTIQALFAKEKHAFPELLAMLIGVF